MANTTERDSHEAFFRLLCRAAGVDHLKVVSIDCFAGAGENTTFNVKLVGESVHLSINTVEDVHSGDGTK
jgi:hypothetical protein